MKLILPEDEHKNPLDQESIKRLNRSHRLYVKNSNGSKLKLDKYSYTFNIFVNHLRELVDKYNEFNKDRLFKNPLELFATLQMFERMQNELRITTKEITFYCNSNRLFILKQDQNDK